MKGRKPKQDAIRRGRQPFEELTPVQTSKHDLVKPEHILANPRLNQYWEIAVGDGHAYDEQDLPIILNYITYMDLADQLRDQLFDENGAIQTIMGYGPLDEEGMGGKVVESPYFKQYEKAVNMCLKLAQELGTTPMARARLGVTRAAEQSMNVDIGMKIREMMKAEGY